MESPRGQKTPKPGGPRHPSRYAYNRGCRCEKCMAHMRIKWREAWTRRKATKRA